MAQNIPMASAIVAGLFSQEDKIKLDALPGSITGSAPDPLSSSIQRSHQLSASYFSMSSGSIDTLSATTVTIANLIVQNSNITASSVPDPLSSSVQRAHNLSASYFEFISGNVRTLTGTGLQTTWFSASSGTVHVETASYLTGTEFKARTGSFSIVNSHIMTGTNFTASSGSVHVLTASYLTGNTITIQDLVVINSNITASSVLLSASTVRAHNLSASYFEFISGNVRTLTGTTSVTSPRGVFTDLVVINTNITATIPDPLSSSVQRSHNLSASYFQFISGNVRTLTGTGISGSSGTYHVLTGAYLSGNTLTVQDLVVINSNITASSALLSSSIVRAHNLSASYFEFISGNVRTLTGTTSVTSPRGVFTDLVVTNTNITATIPDPLSSSVQRSHNLSASYYEFISGNVRTLTGTGISGSSGTFHVVTASYLSATSKIVAGNLDTWGAVSFNAPIQVYIGGGFTTDGYNSTMGGGSLSDVNDLSASNVSAFNLSASYFEFISGNVKTLTGTTSVTSPRGVFTDLVVINTNITATIPDPLSSSVQRSHNLSASYFEFISGNVRTLTGTGLQSTWLSASSGTYHVLTGAYLSGNTLTVQDLVVINSNITASSALLSASIIRSHNLSASYFQFISGNVRTLTGTGISGSSGTYHVLTGAYIVSTLLTGTGISGSSGTYHVLTGAYLTSTIAQIFNISASFAGIITASINNMSASAAVKAFNLSASYYEFISGNVRTLTGTGISGSSGTYHVLTGAYVTGTSGTYHQFSASYLSATRLTVTDLVAINTNITSTIPDPLSSSIQRSHNLSASYFEFISGNVRTLTGTGLQATWLSASSGTYHVLTSTYIKSSRIENDSLLITASNLILNSKGNITLQNSQNNIALIADNGKIQFGAWGTNNAIEVVTEDADIQISAPGRGVRIVATATIIPQLLTASTGQFNNLSASYYQFISGNVRTLTGTGISGSSGTYHVLTGAYISGTSLYITNLVAINTNITASVPDPLSSSIQRAHQLSASYFQFISGNVRTLTGTGIGSTQISGTYITASQLDINLVNNISPQKLIVKNTAFSSSASGTQFIPELSQSINANETWAIKFMIHQFCSGSQGARYTIFAPTGSFIMGWTTVYSNSDLGSVARHYTFYANSLNTEIPFSVGNSAAQFEYAHQIELTIRNGANAGDVKLGVRRMTAADFLHVTTGSYIHSIKGEKN